MGTPGPGSLYPLGHMWTQAVTPLHPLTEPTPPLYSATGQDLSPGRPCPRPQPLPLTLFFVGENLSLLLAPTLPRELIPASEIPIFKPIKAGD